MDPANSPPGCEARSLFFLTNGHRHPYSQLVDIESISGNESRSGIISTRRALPLGYRLAKSQWKATALMSTPHPGAPESRNCFFHAYGYGSAVHTVFGRCGPIFTAEVRVMPKASSLRKSPHQSAYEEKVFMSACCSWWVKSVTAWERKSPMPSRKPARERVQVSDQR